MVRDVVRACGSLSCIWSTTRRASLAAASTRRASTRKARPVDVKSTCRVVRMNNAAPSSSSGDRIDADKPDWTICSRSAARVKFCSDATAKVFELSQIHGRRPIQQNWCLILAEYTIGRTGSEVPSAQSSKRQLSGMCDDTQRLSPDPAIGPNRHAYNQGRLRLVGSRRRLGCRMGQPG